MTSQPNGPVRAAIERACFVALSSGLIEVERPPKGITQFNRVITGVAAPAIRQGIGPGQTTTAVFLEALARPGDISRAIALNWRVLLVDPDTGEAAAAVRADTARGHGHDEAVTYVCRSWRHHPTGPALPSTAAVRMFPELARLAHKLPRETIEQCNAAAGSATRFATPQRRGGPRLGPPPRLGRYGWQAAPKGYRAPLCAACGTCERVAFGFAGGKVHLCATCAPSHHLHRGSPDDFAAAKLQSQILDLLGGRA